jgi:hypothetical protein
MHEEYYLQNSSVLIRSWGHAFMVHELRTHTRELVVSVSSIGISHHRILKLTYA